MKLRIILLALFIIVALAIAQSGLATKPTLAGAIAAATTATPTPASTNNDNISEHDQDISLTKTITGNLSQQEQIFQVTIATYLMDTAGFHEMDERINQKGLIEAGDAGVINRVSSVLVATAWPEGLQAQIDPLKDTLSQYAEALANDDLEAAKPLASQAHDQQHDLSHAAAAWLGEMTGSSEHEHSEE